MQTIFISTSMPGRARPDYFMALAHSFTNKGYRVFMIIDGKPKNLPVNDDIIFLRWPNKRPTKLKDIQFLWKLIKKYKPFVLISSFGSVNVMNICGFFLKVKNRVNYILSVSEPFYEKTTNHKRLKRYFLKIRKHLVYKLATLIIYNSRGTEIDSKSYFNLENKEFLVLYNLVESTDIEYKLKEKRNNQIVIVGSLIKRKGHIFLLNQFKDTIKIFPELKLLIIGSGSEKQNLLKEVKNLGLEKNVEFLGEVPNKEIDHYFSNSLISISASKHEAFGFVNIEALREGTPVISTKTAGGLEIINNNINGCFFSLDVQNSLTKSIKKLMRDWESYSENAKQSFDSYSMEKQIDVHRGLLISKFR